MRVIAATNKHLDEEIRQGRFREDLFFRLAVLSIHLPPLRERREDIPLLCEHFLKKYGDELKKGIRGVSARALERLAAYAWPGNVRELENVIYEAMVLSDAKVIDERDLPRRIRQGAAAEAEAAGETLKGAAQAAAENAEMALIEKALRDSGGNRTLAARTLGVSRKTLFNKMKALGILNRSGSSPRG